MDIIITTDFAALEASLRKIEATTVAYWVSVWGEYKDAAEAQEEGVALSVRAWSIAWQAAVKTRSAQAVQQTLSHIKWADDKGYDLSSFVSIEHIKECKGGKKPAPAAGKKSAKARRLALTHTAAFKALPEGDQVKIREALGL